MEGLEELKTIIDDRLASIHNMEDLNNVRTYILGRKGLFSEYIEKIKELDKDEKKLYGQRLNSLKEQTENKIKELKANLEEGERQAAERSSWIDITLPGKIPIVGNRHPITKIFSEIIEIFASLGFSVAEGPDIELDYYNFEALNIPPHHPARDMQDTFYIKDGVVLRTHTSPVQVRVMESQLPPVRIISPGAVYRCDNDISHTPMFHQVEGLMVDKGIRFSDLKGILTIFIHEIFGDDTSLRFRPSYFPFTEPSAEVDIRCVICKGSGCRVCKETGWLEILGFAFGMGVERIAMLKYGIDDIRQFYYNDLRFLSQF